jgi:hypothetical protein
MAVCYLVSSMMFKAPIDDSKHKGARRPRIAPNEPEWCDIRGLEKLFGIRETMAYQLIRARAFRSILMKRPGRARGKRLVSLASVREFLAGLEGGK